MNPRIKTNLHDPNPWAPPTFPTSTCRYFCWNIELGFFPQVLILSPKMTTFSALFRSFFALFWAWFLFPFLLFEGGRGRYRETERERERPVSLRTSKFSRIWLIPSFSLLFFSLPSHHLIIHAEMTLITKIPKRVHNIYEDDRYRGRCLGPTSGGH